MRVTIKLPLYFGNFIHVLHSEIKSFSPDKVTKLLAVDDLPWNRRISLLLGLGGLLFRLGFLFLRFSSGLFLKFCCFFNGLIKLILRLFYLLGVK